MFRECTRGAWRTCSHMDNLQARLKLNGNPLVTERKHPLSTHRAIAGLFAFGSPDWAAAPDITEDDCACRETAGESAAVRVLYQAAPKKKPAHPRRGTPIRDFIASVLESLLPRPAPVLVPVPVRGYGRGR